MPLYILIDIVYGYNIKYIVRTHYCDYQFIWSYTKPLMRYRDMCCFMIRAKRSYKTDEWLFF